MCLYRKPVSSHSKRCVGQERKYWKWGAAPFSLPLPIFRLLLQHLLERSSLLYRLCLTIYQVTRKIFQKTKYTTYLPSTSSGESLIGLEYIVAFTTRSAKQVQKHVSQHQSFSTATIAPFVQADRLRKLRGEGAWRAGQRLTRFPPPLKEGEEYVRWIVLSSLSPLSTLERAYPFSVVLTRFGSKR